MLFKSLAQEGPMLLARICIQSSFSGVHPDLGLINPSSVEICPFCSNLLNLLLLNTSRVIHKLTIGFSFCRDTATDDCRMEAIP